MNPDVKGRFILYSAQEGSLTENAKSAIMAASQQDILDKINTAEVRKNWRHPDILR